MSTKLRNKKTGEIITTPYALSEAYEPWEIISDTQSKLAMQRLVKQTENEMSKTSKWVQELQSKCGFTEDEHGNPIINWKVPANLYEKNVTDSLAKMKFDLQNLENEIASAKIGKLPANVREKNVTDSPAKMKQDLCEARKQNV